MLRERKNLLWLVVLFLGACAVIGFLTGIKGSLPSGEPSPMAGTPVAEPSGKVIEAAPLEEAILTPPAQPEPKQAEPEPQAEADPAEEEEAPPAPEPKPKEKAPPPKAKAPPPQPKPKAEPAEDPLGDLLESLPPDAVIY